VIPAFARAAQTVSDQGSDSPHLVGLVEQIANNLAAPPEQISADAGYCSEDNLAALETRGIDAYVATGRRKHGAAAPAARPAKPESRVAAMAEKLGSAGHQGPYRLRKQVVEPVFGQIASARFSPIPAAWLGPGAERMVADPHRTRNQPILVLRTQPGPPPRRQPPPNRTKFATPADHRECIARHYPDGLLDAMRALWEQTGLKSIDTWVIQIPITYSDFDDFWESNTLAVGPADQAIREMSPSARE
jgi:hypothetical protein